MVVSGPFVADKKLNLHFTCVLTINELFKSKTFFGWEVVVSLWEHKIAFMSVSQSMHEIWELRLSIEIIIIQKIMEKKSHTKRCTYHYA